MSHLIGLWTGFCVIRARRYSTQLMQLLGWHSINAALGIAKQIPVILTKAR